MSALVHPSGFQWFRPDCVAGQDGFETEREADAAAARHDELNEHEATS